MFFCNFNNKVSKHCWRCILVAGFIINTLNDYSDKSEHPELIQTVIQYIKFKQLQIKVHNDKKGRINSIPKYFEKLLNQKKTFISESLHFISFQRSLFIWLQIKYWFAQKQPF